ncbi:MAG: hypothetical protein QF383_03365 [Flavobacteriales bacterium]|jgi:hypothetical protein|nr:hypothetical protein [Flavobacteriales bacterium]
MKNTLLLITAFALTFSSCKKDKSIETNLEVNFSQTVNGESLEQNALQYTNADGQDYSVKKLWYIISDITLHSDEGENVIKDYHFIDISNPSTLSFTINDLEDGNYTSISYIMGLDSTKNISNLYVNEAFHTTMFWPEMMGGGYHYMKLEGNFTNDTTFYNTHTGGTMGMDYSFTQNNVISLITDEKTLDVSLSINMEIKNWYQNPNTISLTTDGIMGNMELQMQLKQNGADVFSTTIN